MTSVRVNSLATIVTVRATDSGGEAIRLPIFGNAQLTVPGANRLTPDPFAGTFNEQVPAGGETTGTIVFDGALGTEVSMVTLSFSTIFGPLGGPQNIAVDLSIAPGRLTALHPIISRLR